MLRRLFIGLVIGVCSFSLSLHFIVEGLGGVHDHFIGHQLTRSIDSHDGDQFILGEAETGDTAQTIFHVIVPSSLIQISQPLPPPFHPPNSL